MTKFYLSLSRYLTALLILITSIAWAQSRTVTGKVTSADDGTGLPGVNVIEKGTNNGTATDAEGTFTINVGNNSTLVFSFVGYASQEMAVGTQTTVNITLVSDVTSLSEVVVVGYGSQEKKELTSSVVSLGEKDFNKGNINDPVSLLQGKVPGLSVYNRGGNPNSGAAIRLRGISTLGQNIEPLVVVDGVIGASLNNIDPNDIESINVLKDGSAAAIYGSRGSSGVILVTTKKGSSRAGAVSATYNGYVAASTIYNKQPVMTASEYIAAGGNDLGSVTDWQDEVTQTGVTDVHNIAVAGGNATTTFRMATNFRNVEGILKESGFNQVNARANLNHRTLNDKLTLDFNVSLTNREIQNSFNEALRYAVLFNPTAPIKFPTGGYYQAILFDNFNPVAIIEQNVNEGKRKTLNFNAKIDYNLFKGFTLTANIGQQYETGLNNEYYSRESLFRGLNRGGLARRSTYDNSFNLVEVYGTYSSSFGSVNLDVTGGYSFQQDESQSMFVELGNFPNDQLGYNALENAGDRISGLGSLVNISSDRSPKNQIAAQFARVNLTFSDAIFFNASVRREGSTKLGEDNRYGIFPAAGVGVDLNKYLNLANVNILKLRVGYGVTGSLPGSAGLAQDRYDYSFNGGGSITYAQLANKELKWEEKTEINAGVDFGLGGKLSGSVDVYTRKISDFVNFVTFLSGGTSQAAGQFQNSGQLTTNGIELALNYNALEFGQVRWNPGIVLSSYNSVLDEFISDAKAVMTNADLGAPGQNNTPLIRVAVGEELGQIWGPVFDGVNEANGTPIFKDLNGDGTIKAAPGSALEADGDYQQLGSGFPKLELGWTNQVSFKNWDLNIFFRGAFGHSLINSFRAFYEPLDPGAINSYNRIKTDKAVAGLTTATYSSLYVEKADFFKLDNLTLGYNFSTSSTNLVKSARIYFGAQNLFVMTGYTGIDPEPQLQDFGSPDNGGFDAGNPDVLSPGIDRRNSYFTNRTFTIGVNIGI